MEPEITKQVFLRVVAEEGPKLFSQAGFSKTGPATFWRRLDGVEHGIFLRPEPGFTCFTFSVGATAPPIDRRTDYIDFGGKHYPTLLVSRRLGEFRQNSAYADSNYCFTDAKQLRALFPKVYTDFVEQAEPWLEQLKTIDGVAREFYKRRIGPPSSGEDRPPDPFAWAIYGWLLQECGHHDVARSWLEKAYEFVKQPVRKQEGRVFPRVPGVGPIPYTAEDKRLIELLEKDLQ